MIARHLLTLQGRLQYASFFSVVILFQSSAKGYMVYLRERMKEAALRDSDRSEGAPINKRLRIFTPDSEYRVAEMFST